MPIGFDPQKHFDINNNKKGDFHSKKIRNQKRILNQLKQH